MRKFLFSLLIYASFLVLFFPLTTWLYHTIPAASDFDKLEVHDVVKKFHHFIDHRGDYNTVFVGSSMVYRHVNSKLFDSICHTKSFNLGSGGFRPLRSFDMLEMLYQENLDLDYIFFELNRFETLKQNFNTGPSIRSMSWKNYSIAASSVVASDYPVLRKAQYFAMYTYTLTYKYFGTGILGQIAKESQLVDSSPTDPLIRNNGFYALDEEVSLTHDVEAVNRNKYLSNHRFLLDTLASVNIFDAAPGYNPPSLAYADYMKELQIRFGNHGTQLVFFINPRNFNKGDVIFLNQVAFYLPHVIKLYDSREYPAFYDYRYSFDMAHLTGEGADQYTRILAQEFIKENTDK